jgi:hypothetical protein
MPLTDGRSTRTAQPEIRSAGVRAGPGVTAPMGEQIGMRQPRARRWSVGRRPGSGGSHETAQVFDGGERLGRGELARIAGDELVSLIACQ